MKACAKGAGGLYSLRIREKLSEKSDETCGLLKLIPLLPLDVGALNLQARRISENGEKLRKL